jgi:hypothetical protein
MIHDPYKDCPRLRRIMQKEEVKDTEKEEVGSFPTACMFLEHI